MNCCVWPPRSIWHRKSDKIQSDENQTEFSGWVASIIQYFWSNNEVYQLFVLMFRNASPQIPKLRQRIKQAISAAESSRPIPMTWVELLVASVGTDPSSLIWHLLSFKLRIKKWQVSMAYHVWCWHVLTTCLSLPCFKLFGMAHTGKSKFRNRLGLVQDGSGCGKRKAAVAEYVEHVPFSRWLRLGDPIHFHQPWPWQCSCLFSHFTHPIKLNLVSITAI